MPSTIDVLLFLPVWGENGHVVDKDMLQEHVSILVQNMHMTKPAARRHEDRSAALNPEVAGVSGCIKKAYGMVCRFLRNRPGQKTAIQIEVLEP